MSTPNDNFECRFDENGCPEDFLEYYEPLECLASSAECETLYVKNRCSGDFAVAKCYTDKALLSRDNESRILKALHHDGLPLFLGEYENDNMLCVVREYVKGVPLSECLGDSPLTEQETIPILLQLCDILTYLHNQSPAIIHRDIKPQNIILTDEGKVKLIDFGISRTYDENAKIDTVFFGTQEFAPPEQYGFSQTNNRADLFSLGVVMGWLLTGDTDPKGVKSNLQNKRLLHIYQKCTAFAPNERYASAAKLKAALLHSDGKRQKMVMRSLAVMFLCVVFLSVGFAVGRYTDLFTPAPVGVVFEEPMIEQAVRLQLGKIDEEPITEEDLISVTELYIFGSDIIAKTEMEMNSRADELFQTNQMKTGSIRTLSDLEKMPNLQKVSVAMQQISDLTPLAGLKRLEELVLKNNPIEDITPLSGLKNLQRVSLFDTMLDNFSPLKDCLQLKQLDAGETLVRTPAAFTELTYLTNLNLYKLTLDTLSGIEQLSRLEFIEIAGVADGDLSPLLALPFLKEVMINEDLRQAAEKIADRAQFTISYR